MLRVGELVMVLAPIVGLVVVYFIVSRGARISGRVLALAVLVVFAFGGWLTWLGTSDRLDPLQRYVPAQLRNGTIVQGHGE
jgi:amino acid transporter